jgi:hypothetical protein
MNTFRRTASGAVIALILAFAAAAPAAAAQPTRTVYHLTGGTHAAGQGCTFDITYVDTPGSRQTVTDYSDGREATDTHAIATLMNVTNGKTFVHKAFFHDVYRFDPATNTYVGMTNGQVINWFYPGDVSPYGGIVGPDGLAIRYEGTIWYTYDATTFALIAFSYQGTATNVCDLLS